MGRVCFPQRSPCSKLPVHPLPQCASLQLMMMHPCWPYLQPERQARRAPFECSTRTQQFTCSSCRCCSLRPCWLRWSWASFACVCGYCPRRSNAHTLRARQFGSAAESGMGGRRKTEERGGEWVILRVANSRKFAHGKSVFGSGNRRRIGVCLARATKRAGRLDVGGLPP